MTTYWCERALPGTADAIVDGLTVVVDGTHIVSTKPEQMPPDGAIRLAGLTIPGFANCHSHAFHRALRGGTQRDRGTFWTWRELMYDVAAGLDPDSYYALALATYREMALAGITAVGEFHYLHHQPDGTPYADPNAMGAALIAAARDAGIRITLLDTCYLAASFDAEPEGVQVRFSDRTADGWLERVDGLRTGGPDVVIGHAIHSVRAVPKEAMPLIAAANPSRPLHVHVSEQVAENDACLAAHGVTPTALLAEQGVLDARTSLVHATHLTAEDMTAIGEARSFACFCPTTERDLADGVGPATELATAGARLTIGSDSHAVIDPFEELRAVELDERLATMERGRWRAADLLAAGGRTGHESLGFPDAGRIAPGQWADLVTIDLESPRTAGTGGADEAVVFAASAADITSVVASGRSIPIDRAATGRALARSIAAVVGASAVSS